MSLTSKFKYFGPCLQTAKGDKMFLLLYKIKIKKTYYIFVKYCFSKDYIIN